MAKTQTTFLVSASESVPLCTVIWITVTWEIISYWILRVLFIIHCCFAFNRWEHGKNLKLCMKHMTTEVCRFRLGQLAWCYVLDNSGPPLFLTLSQQTGWRCTRSWEGTEFGQMNPTDSRDIPHHIMSNSAYNTGRGGGDFGVTVFVLTTNHKSLLMDSWFCFDDTCSFSFISAHGTVKTLFYPSDFLPHAPVGKWVSSWVGLRCPLGLKHETTLKTLFLTEWNKSQF